MAALTCGAGTSCVGTPASKRTPRLVSSARMCHQPLRSCQHCPGSGCSAATSSPHPQPPCRRGLNVVCMAHPRRVAKVASQIQREISDMLITDDVLVAAVTPERAGGLTELSAVASVTDVYVSNDLQVVKVYVSIYSDERGKQKAMNNLKRLEGYVRREMGQRVQLRLTPVYRFEYDDTLEEADLVERVIGQEDVARFTAELAQEEAHAKGLPWPGEQAEDGKPGRSKAKAAAAADDDDGFFNEYRAEAKHEARQARHAPGRISGPFDDLFEQVEQKPEQQQQQPGKTRRKQGSRQGSQGGQKAAVK